MIYIVATNSLESNAENDIDEIIEGVAKCDLTKNAVFVYECNTHDDPALYRIIHRHNRYEKHIVRSYSNDVSSLNQGRISTVISDFRNSVDASEYGAVFWSHALAWIPSELSAKIALHNPGEYPAWFGDDYNKHINIPELADAIPSDFFSFIWMDCCYMGSIEVAYQFRNKCRYYIAYPTEVQADGMPYDKTMSYLLSNDNSGLIDAAVETFNYYAEHLDPGKRSCTISVIDMNYIERLASLANEIYRNFAPPIEIKKLQCYSRGTNPPLYDFLQYTERIGQKTGNLSALGEFTSTLRNMVIYKHATPKFLSLTIDPSLYSGLSVYAYGGNNDSEIDVYYQSLDWFKAVYH